MTTINILFWLLIALVGGIVWAFAAGLAYRHRNLLASSLLASVGSGLIITFGLNDVSATDLSPPPQQIQDKAAADSKANGDLSGSKEQDQATAADGAELAAKPKTAANGAPETDESKIVYSRIPFRDCPECPQIVIIPKGEALLGSPLDEKGRTRDERTLMRASIAKPFAIGRIELLKSDYRTYVKETSYVSTTQCNTGSRRRGKFDWNHTAFEQDDRHAVSCLDIKDVTAYLAWLSKKSGRTYRLPTEIEWEYAARAKTETPYTTGTSISTSQGNFGRSRDGTTVGGSFEMNEFGLSDLAGNLWEMTSDCRPLEDGVAHDTCQRIIKGGSWNSAVSTLRPAARNYMPDGTSTNTVGVRVMRDLDERDSDRILTLDQRKALEHDEKLAAEIKQREAEERDKAIRDAREAAANPAPPPPPNGPHPK